LKDVSVMCDLLKYINGSYGDFINGMLQSVAMGFGDPQLPTKTANVDNRVPALRSTDLLVQLSLAANSRYASGSSFLRNANEVSYVSTSDATSRQVLAVPLAAQYAVKPNRTLFRYAVRDSGLPLLTQQGPASNGDSGRSRKFKYHDWDAFHLYPASGNRDIFASTPTPSTSGSRGSLAEPFGGHPSVVQLAAASSASMAYLSGLAPSLYAQYVSVQRYDDKHVAGGILSQSKKLALDELQANALYNSDLTGGLAVCTQWPLECGAADGRFVDGGFTDGPCKCLAPLLYVQRHGMGDHLSTTYSLFFFSTGDEYWTIPHH
jgi:hypothetical protein